MIKFHLIWRSKQFQMRFFRVCFFCFFSIATWAQQSQWQSVSIADGLSQGMIYDMIQDKTGFLWLATKDGLNRYDGNNFKVFTNDPYNENSISGNTCTALLEDDRGHLWIGTDKDGINLYNPENRRFYHANVLDKDRKGAGNYTIYRLKTDASGTLWILTDNPEKIFKIKPFEGFPETSDFSDRIEAVPQTNNGLSLQGEFDKQSLGFGYAKRWYASRQPDYFTDIFQANFAIFKYLTDRQERIWNIGLATVYCKKGSFSKSIEFPPGQRQNVLNQWDDGTLVISNQMHVWVFTPEELLKTDRLTPQNAYAALPPNTAQVSLFVKDITGSVWAATQGYGLLKFNPRTRQFRSFLSGYSPAALLQSRAGEIYFHANYLPSYNIFKLNAASGAVTPLPIAPSGKYYGHDALLQDRQAQFWLLYNKGNGAERYLMKFTKEWQPLKKYAVSSTLRVPVDYSCRMSEDKNGSIWLGLANGELLRFNPLTEQFESHSYRSLLPQSGSIVQTYALYPEANGTLWIATQKGLVKMENFPGRPKFSIYKNSKTDRQSLSNDFVSGMINDPLRPENYLWVSTKGGGLERLNKQTGHFEHFTETRGLPNKVVYGILQGDDNNLWMSTNRGIACLNPKTLIFTSFNKSDGLQDDEFNTNSYFKAPSGELMFGGINGITVFSASAVAGNKNKPTARIIDLKVNNASVEPGDKNDILAKAIEHSDAVELAHDQNLITFEFAVMDFTNPVKNRFRYRLEGIDKEWVEAGTNRFANYAQLPDGHFTFQVTGSANGEVWSDPVALHIRIHPPFYQTWWAYLVYLAAVFTLGYRWYKNQLNRVRLQQQLLYKDKEAERLSELDTLKTNFFTNISHEFRTPLTLLVGPLADFQKKYPSEGLIPLMQRNLTRLQTLINQLLDLSKLEAGKMEPHIQYSDLPQFLKYVFASFESLSQTKNIIFQPSQSHSHLMAYYDEDKIEKIVTNLLSNAFKFTPENGRVTVHVEYSPGPLPAAAIITVTDNGIGIDPQQLPRIFDRFYQTDDGQRRHYEGTGIGLALVKELVHALHGSIEVTSELKKGTEFVVKLPCDQAHWGQMLSTAADSEFSEKPAIDSFAKESNDFSNGRPGAPDLPILLIVEDNPDLRTYVRGIFEDHYQLIEARDGQEGFEKALELIPDIVISDLMMPRLDGLGFCKALKSDPKTNHIPVVMLTAKAALEDRLEGLEGGADEYLPKPFNTAELKLRVRNLLQQRQLLQQKYSRIPAAAEVVPIPSQPLSMDEQFLHKANQTLKGYVTASSFDIEKFASEMNMTSTQLRRKLKALTGQTITEFVRNYRLEKAAELLKQKAGTIAEIAFMVGFESPSYFSKTFMEKFGKAPSEWS